MDLSLPVTLGQNAVDGLDSGWNGWVEYVVLPLLHLQNELGVGICLHLLPKDADPPIYVPSTIFLPPDG